MTRAMLSRRALLAQGVALCALPAFAQGGARLLSIGGSVTEIVHALDQGHQLIARDTTSTYPLEVTDLPDVGYARALSPEGVLSVDPSHILAIEDAGPPETIQVLKESGIPFTSVPDAHDGPGILKKIAVVGDALDAAAAQTARIAPEKRKRVLFILSLQGGRILAGGRETQAEGIIEMAGGINAVDAFSGYKQMTDEAISETAPDVILMMDRGGDHAVADDVLLTMPAIRTTPAAKAEAVIRMQGLYLLGFGPRTAQAARDLNTAIYGTPQDHDDTDPS
jgi:iron complex transport system substrate-binding protein